MKAEGGPSDPRLQKASSLQPPSRPADPRLARDPRLSRASDPGSSAESGAAASPSSASSSTPADPRLARHAASLHHKPDVPHAHKPPASTPGEEEEVERVLRDKPVPIPLEPLMGMALRDPRSQLQQFSHIKKDIMLHKPHFSKGILWNPEDLIPVPIPKQDFLPLPPGIPPVSSLDPRLSRAQQQLHTAPTSAAAPAPPPAADPTASAALPDFDLLSRILKTVNASGTSPTPPTSSGPAPAAPAATEKPVDPRTARKAPADPRLQPQKSALKQSTESPAPSASTTSSVPSPPTIAPYDPRLLSAGGTGRGVGSGGGSQSSVLSGISLYDPRTQSAAKSDGAAASTSTSGVTSTPEPAKAKAKEPLFVRKSALDQPEAEKSAAEPATDRYNSYNRPRPKPAPSPSGSASTGAAAGTSSAGPAPTAASEQPPPAVHNLPVSTLFSMVKQAGKPSGTGSPFGGSSPAETDSADQDAASLKDVFKGFDPTASPFCQ